MSDGIEKFEQVPPVRAQFSSDRVGESDVDRVTLSIVGDPNTIIQKVTPEHIQRFPREYEAFKRHETKIDHGGTSLLDVPGIDKDIVARLNYQGVYNAEQLAGLSDGQVSDLGNGTQTLRATARLLVRNSKKSAA